MTFPKTLALAFVLIAFQASNAFAQRADLVTEHPSVIMRASPPVIADVTTREMSNRFRLNEGQYLKLNAINRTHALRVAQINEQYPADAATRQSKLTEIEAQYQQEYRQILTPDQLSLINEEQAPANAESGNGRG